MCSEPCARKQPATVLWMLACIGLACIGLASTGLAADESLPTDAELEKAGAVFGAIRIDNKNVFDEQDPKDNKALFRLAD